MVKKQTVALQRQDNLDKNFQQKPSGAKIKAIPEKPAKKAKQPEVKQRINLRKRPKKKKDPNFIKDIEFLDDPNFLLLSLHNSFYNTKAVEIQIKAGLYYRYTSNQIEIIGEWTDYSFKTSQPLSYLLQNKQSILFPIQKNQIDYSDSAGNLSRDKYIKDNKYLLTISHSNLMELILIKNISLRNEILHFLSGQYSGYFINRGKTVEDTFFISFILDSNDVSKPKIVGNGQNFLGEYELVGNIEFLKDKEEMIQRNSLKDKNKEKDSTNYAFLIGDITLRRIYLYEKAKDNKTKSI